MPSVWHPLQVAPTRDGHPHLVCCLRSLCGRLPSMASRNAPDKCWKLVNSWRGMGYRVSRWVIYADLCPIQLREIFY